MTILLCIQYMSLKKQLNVFCLTYYAYFRKQLVLFYSLKEKNIILKKSYTKLG